MNPSEIVTTEDGSLTLRHPEHGECFHSLGGALLEARSLYVEGSDLLHIVSQGTAMEPIRILDVGLGLGYNAISSIDALASFEGPTTARIEMTSLECDRELFQQLRTGLAPWQLNWPDDWKRYCTSLVQESDDHSAFSASFQLPFAQLNWCVFLGDALRFDVWQKNARPYDFIWQDPFSPQHNPTMWSPDWFEALHRVAKSQQTRLMTYSVARATREALEQGGWACEKIPGRGKKRQWLRALAR